MKTSMPWDDAVESINFEERNRPLNHEDEEMKKDEQLYGQAKPRRVYIVGDITSDKD